MYDEKEYSGELISYQKNPYHDKFELVLQLFDEDQLQYHTKTMTFVIPGNDLLTLFPAGEPYEGGEYAVTVRYGQDWTQVIQVVDLDPDITWVAAEDMPEGWVDEDHERVSLPSIERDRLAQEQRERQKWLPTKEDVAKQMALNADNPELEAQYQRYLRTEAFVKQYREEQPDTILTDSQILKYIGHFDDDGYQLDEQS
ncbi:MULTISPECIES: hypothetical protein [Weissella]|uniref:Uncharacterized protein n=2 Tax=Weissella TaxID=46255 RepID=A0ABT6D7T0_9LACO|nr:MULTISPECIES: hypothetical protein [unclassified Weissella]MCW0927995.1 hypothetical protein [Weissella sp. LMG 11983]MDF9300585.1 hypothetical protein [Weissella sp. BK2]